MRMAKLVEVVVFTIGFLILCGMILIGRPAQPAPVRRAASTSVRRGIAG